MLYAVLNENNKCIYVADFTTGEQNFIKIDENANSMFFIGKYYDAEKNIFYEKPQPTNAELMAEIKKSQQDVIDEYTLQLVNEGIL